MQDGSFYGNYTSIHPAPRVKIRFLSLLVALVVFGGFFWLAWYAYHAGTSQAAPAEVPVIAADDEPFRVKPEDPGGMVIPHQDKTVYDAIASQPETKPEKLLPLAEEPMKPEAQNTDEQLRAARQKIVEQARNDERRVEVLTATVPPAPEPEEVFSPVEEKKTAPEPVAEKKEAAPVKEEPVVKAEKAPAKIVVEGKARVQLGAFKTPKEAEQAWQKTRRQHAEVIGAYGFDVEKADLGAKGIFYRLQLVGLKDNAAAQQLCKKLAARQQGCFVVKP